jgi:hypothetical protein
MMPMGETDQSVTTPTTLTYERDRADFGANHPLVEIYPRETGRRDAVRWRGISVELIQPATHDRIENHHTQRQPRARPSHGIGNTATIGVARKQKPISTRNDRSTY